MTCRFCGTWNPEHEHRCVRCSRRLLAATPPIAAPAMENYPSADRGALAPQLVFTDRQPLSAAKPEERAAPMQGTLFTPGAFRPKDGSKVVPLINPLPSPPLAPPRETPPKVHTTVNPRRTPPQGQQRL